MGRRALSAIFGAIIVSLPVLVPATAAAEGIQYEFSFVYGEPTDYPVMGDWNGDGIDTPGVVRGNSWYLSNTYNGSVDLSFTYGIAGDVAVVGDWNGDGVDTPGVFRFGMWYLSNTFGGAGDYIFGYAFGFEDLPVVGDWDGNGTDTPAVVQKVSLCNDCLGGLGGAPGTDWRLWIYEWTISNDLQGTPGHTFVFDHGMDMGKSAAGDWDADGVDTPGAYYKGTWYLSNTFGGTNDFIFSYGNPDDTPFVGRFGNNPAEFISDGPDTYGVWRAGVWYARTHHTPTNEEPPYVAPSPPSFDEPAEDYSQEAFQTQVLPIWAKYAPEVRLHPDEQYWPARVIAHFLQHAELKYSFTRSYSITKSDAGFGEIEAWRLGLGSGIRSYPQLGCTGGKWFKASDLTRPYESGRIGCLAGSQEGFFLNLDDDFRAGEPNNLANVPVYYEFLSGRYVQYYFFYAYDDAFPGNIADHEGDWERIVIKLSPTNTPQRVAYYFHNCQFLDRDWNAMPKVDNNGNASSSGTHLVVWAARGTHGSWPEVGDGQRDHCSPLGIGDDHLSNAGRRWRTWRHMINANQAPWYGFGGAWGERGLYSSTTGPLGPYPGKKLPPAGW